MATQPLEGGSEVSVVVHGPALPPEVKGIDCGEVQVDAWGVDWLLRGAPPRCTLQIAWWGHRGPAIKISLPDQKARQGVAEVARACFVCRSGPRNMAHYFRDMGVLPLMLEDAARPGRQVGLTEVHIERLDAHHPIQGSFPVSAANGKTVGMLRVEIRVIYYTTVVSSFELNEHRASSDSTISLRAPCRTSRIAAIQEESTEAAFSPTMQKAGSDLQNPAEAPVGHSRPGQQLDSDDKNGLQGEEPVRGMNQMDSTVQLVSPSPGEAGEGSRMGVASPEAEAGASGGYAEAATSKEGVWGPNEQATQRAISLPPIAPSTANPIQLALQDDKLPSRAECPADTSVLKKAGAETERECPAAKRNVSEHGQQEASQSASTGLLAELVQRAERLQQAMRQATRTRAPQPRAESTSPTLVPLLEAPRRSRDRGLASSGGAVDSLLEQSRFTRLPGSGSDGEASSLEEWDRPDSQDEAEAVAEDALLEELFFADSPSPSSPASISEQPSLPQLPTGPEALQPSFLAEAQRVCLAVGQVLLAGQGGELPALAKGSLLKLQFPVLPAALQDIATACPQQSIAMKPAAADSHRLTFDFQSELPISLDSHHARQAWEQGLLQATLMLPQAGGPAVEAKGQLPLSEFLKPVKQGKEGLPWSSLLLKRRSIGKGRAEEEAEDLVGSLDVAFLLVPATSSRKAQVQAPPKPARVGEEATASSFALLVTVGNLLRPAPLPGSCTLVFKSLEPGNDDVRLLLPQKIPTLPAFARVLLPLPGGFAAAAALGRAPLLLLELWTQEKPEVEEELLGLASLPLPLPSSASLQQKAWEQPSTSATRLLELVQGCKVVVRNPFSGGEVAVVEMAVGLGPAAVVEHVQKLHEAAATVQGHWRQFRAARAKLKQEAATAPPCLVQHAFEVTVVEATSLPSGAALYCTEGPVEGGRLIKYTFPGEAEPLYTNEVEWQPTARFGAHARHTITISATERLADRLLGAAKAWPVALQFEICDRVSHKDTKAPLPEGAERLVGTAELPLKDILGLCQESKEFRLPVSLAEGVWKGAGSARLLLRVSYTQSELKGSVLAALDMGPKEQTRQLEVEIKVERAAGLQGAARAGAARSPALAAAQHSGLHSYVRISLFLDDPALEHQYPPVSTPLQVASFTPTYAFAHTFHVSADAATLEALQRSSCLCQVWHCPSALRPEQSLPALPPPVLLATARIPLHLLLLNKEGVSRWHNLLSEEGAVVGALELTLRCNGELPWQELPPQVPSQAQQTPGNHGEAHREAEEGQREELAENEKKEMRPASSTMLQRQTVAACLSIHVEEAVLPAPAPGGGLQSEASERWYVTHGRLGEAETCVSHTVRAVSSSSTELRIPLDHTCTLALASERDQLARQLATEQLQLQVWRAVEAPASAGDELVGFSQVSLAPLLAHGSSGGAAACLSGVYALVHPQRADLRNARLRLRLLLHTTQASAKVDEGLEAQLPCSPQRAPLGVAAGDVTPQKRSVRQEPREETDEALSSMEEGRPAGPKVQKRGEEHHSPGGSVSSSSSSSEGPCSSTARGRQQRRSRRQAARRSLGFEGIPEGNQKQQEEDRAGPKPKDTARRRRVSGQLVLTRSPPHPRTHTPAAPQRGPYTEQKQQPSEVEVVVAASERSLPTGTRDVYANVRICVEAAVHLVNPTPAMGIFANWPAEQESPSGLPSPECVGAYVSYQWAETAEEVCTPLAVAARCPRWFHSRHLPMLSPPNPRTATRCLVLKLWHRTLAQPPPLPATPLSLYSLRAQEVTPEPGRDRLLGCAAMDLTPLFIGMGEVSGWYHVHDLQQRSLGQLKVTVAPVDAVLPPLCLPPAPPTSLPPPASPPPRPLPPAVGRAALQAQLEELDHWQAAMQHRLRSQVTHDQATETTALPTLSSPHSAREDQEKPGVCSKVESVQSDEGTSKYSDGKEGTRGGSCRQAEKDNLEKQSEASLELGQPDAATTAESLERGDAEGQSYGLASAPSASASVSLREPPAVDLHRDASANPAEGPPPAQGPAFSQSLHLSSRQQVHLDTEQRLGNAVGPKLELARDVPPVRLSGSSAQDLESRGLVVYHDLLIAEAGANQSRLDLHAGQCPNDELTWQPMSLPLNGTLIGTVYHSVTTLTKGYSEPNNGSASFGLVQSPVVNSSATTSADEYGYRCNLLTSDMTALVLDKRCKLQRPILPRKKFVDQETERIARIMQTTCS